ncbi:MAG: hypothetical protein N2652_03995 [Kiritimatiellae bacterium]|nr:hypothetical protein [Kiritimatiellia bacterium]
MSTVLDLWTALGSLEVLVEGAPHAPVVAGYTSDLLSDVLGHAPADSVWITVQTHRAVIGVAAAVGIRAVLIAHGRPVPPDTIEAARAQSVAVARSPLSQYELSWRVHAALTRRAG